MNIFIILSLCCICSLSFAKGLTVKTANEATALSNLWSGVFKTNNTFYEFISKDVKDQNKLNTFKSITEDRKKSLPQVSNNGKNWLIKYGNEDFLVVVEDLEKGVLTIAGKPFLFDAKKGIEQFSQGKANKAGLWNVLLPKAQANPVVAAPAAVGYTVFGLMTYATCRDEREGGFFECALAGTLSPIYWAFRAVSATFDPKDSQKKVSKEQFEQLAAAVEQKLKDKDLSVNTADQETIRRLVREQLNDYERLREINQKNSSSGATKN